MNKRMSIKLKKITNGVLAMLIVVSSFGFVPAVQAVGTPTLTIGSQTAINGAHIVVPITGNNFTTDDDIVALQFRVNYDNTLLLFTGFTAATTGASTINDVGEYVNIVWDSSSALILGNETFVSLKFDVISSSSIDTSLVHSNKLVGNSAGNPVTTTINDGVVSLNPAATLSNIAVTTPATKLIYTVGDALDISGLVVTGTYSDTSTKVESITADNISGFNSSAPATGQVLTITIGGKTTTYTIDIVAALSSAKAMTAFSFTSPAATGIINESAKTIVVEVPFGTDVSALVPTITTSAGATVNPASGVAQNFSSPIEYTVTAENSSTQMYVVTVTVVPNSAKTIIAFSFSEGVGVIDESAKTIAVTVPYTTVVVALVPTIITTGASVSPASGVAQDFTTPVTYTVTAADSSTQSYIVTVTVAEPSDLTALIAAIANAQGKYDAAVEGNSTGKYPAPLKANLLAAITAASAITNVSYQPVVDAAVATLNAAIVTFEAGVVPPDVEAPVITLLGEGTITLPFGDVYTDAGATAVDNRDGDITANIIIVNPVDINAVGTYTITYNVSDAEGNAAQQVTRTVNVVDNTAPVITILGENPVIIELNASYTDAGATAVDNVDGNITDRIIQVETPFPVDMSVAGTYSITYRVSDLAGNVIIAKRTIRVLPAMSAGKIALATEMTLNAEQYSVVVGMGEVGSAVVHVPVDVAENAHLDVTALVEQISENTKRAVLADDITANVTTTIGAVSVQIPATTITTTADWTGTIGTPKVLDISSVTLPPTEGRSSIPTVAILVGAKYQTLTLDRAARLTIPGEAGKRVSYERDSLYVPIDTKCSADTQVAGDALPAEGDCTIDVGKDLVIWTKHFTRFVTFQLAGRSRVIVNPVYESVGLAFAEGTTAERRDVTLVLTYGADVTQIAVSKFSDFRGATFEPATHSRAWVLDAGEGEKIVYVVFRNDDGGMTTKSATITLHSGVTAPSEPAVSVAPIPTAQPLATAPVPRVLGVESINVVALEKQQVTNVDRDLAVRLKGQVLTSSDSPEIAWYVDPVSLEKYAISDNTTAFRALENFGLGITNDDLERIPLNTDTSEKTGKLSQRLLGRILLQVEAHGEAWYVHPENGKRSYVANGAEAYQLMQSLRKDIPLVDFRRISVGDLR